MKIFGGIKRNIKGKSLVVQKVWEGGEPVSLICKGEGGSDEAIMRRLENKGFDLPSCKGRDLMQMAIIHIMMRVAGKRRDLE